jgi:hypothetical protein
MIPARFEQIAFGFVLSGLMSLLVSGIAAFRAAAALDGFAAIWAGAWFASWAVAFPVVLVVAPFARRVVRGMVRT